MILLLTGRTGRTLLSLIALVVGLAYVSLFLLDQRQHARAAAGSAAASLDSHTASVADVARMREWYARIHAATRIGELDQLQARIQGAWSVQGAGGIDGLSFLHDNLSRFIDLRREWIVLRERRQRIAGRLILLDRDMERRLAMEADALEGPLAERWRAAFEEAVITLLKLEQMHGRVALERARARFIDAFGAVEAITLEYPDRISPQLDLAVAELVEYGLGGEDNLITLRHRLLDIDDEWRLLETRNRILVDGFLKDLEQEREKARNETARLQQQADRQRRMLRLWLLLSPVLLLLALALAYIRLWRIWRSEGG